MVEQRRGVIAPQPRRPERRRPPRTVVLRRRLLALGVLLAALIGLGFAVASVRERGHKASTPTVAAAPKPFRIVFPEGFTRLQMAARVKSVAEIAAHERGRTPRLNKRAYLAASGRKRLIPGFGRRSLEGFLFPATYQFTVHSDSAELVSAQLRAFRRSWSTINLAYARSKNLTPYDVLMIASMVEKEAVAPEERPKIARVIYNRLHHRMPLGIDATVRYGFHVPGTKSLLESQLNSDNPYNTRKLPGLPPTPIANPGMASIQAAAHPVAGDWLYFVRKPDKVHHFFTASERAFVNYKNAHGFG
ncbi:MAG: endolytic transglycosylase MltG [Actinobacteria bacterium]|nr:MAG: endolytic transglycosylase MltG [Actinomycetota bacterium]